MPKFSAVCSLSLVLLVGSPANAGLLDLLFGGPVKPKVLATFAGGGEAAAEIVAFDARTEQFLVTNAADDRVDVLRLQPVEGEPGSFELALVRSLDPLGSPNSVAAFNGLVAVAAEGANAQAIGHVAFFDLRTPNTVPFTSVPAGALPDMVTFTPNGKYVLVANEGEPSGYDEGDVDPEGSITIVKVSNFSATTAGFTAFNGQSAQLRAKGVRIFGPGATVAQDVEPEYIAVSDDSRWAYVSCQENNALATVNIATGKVVSIEPFGYKDHSLDRNRIDASDREISSSQGAINIQSWPVLGMYQPDAIAATSLFGLIDVVWTANEGDARDYDGFAEEERVKDLELDSTAFPNAADLRKDAEIGRLTVTSTLGGVTVPVPGGDEGDSKTVYRELFAFGGRSFSGYAVILGYPVQIFDSGDDFEQITAAALPSGTFNASNDDNTSFDSRSDNKGPEPEAITIGRVGLRTFAFVGLERVGGVMMYDITNPFAPEFVDYINNRDFSADEDDPEAGDLGPEGIAFVPVSDSPIRGTALIAVANEISGTTTVYALEKERFSLLGLLFGF